MPIGHIQLRDPYVCPFPVKQENLIGCFFLLPNKYNVAFVWDLTRDENMYVLDDEGCFICFPLDDASLKFLYKSPGIERMKNLHGLDSDVIYSRYKTGGLR